MALLSASSKVLTVRLGDAGVVDERPLLDADAEWARSASPFAIFALPPPPLPLPSAFAGGSALAAASASELLVGMP